MKTTLGALACVMMLMVVPLHGQDIESTLSGSTSTQGFTVKDNGGSSLFTIRGDGKVGIGSTTPTAILTVSGLDGFLVTGTYSSGSIPTSGAGTRMMFYPGKAAFRVGYVNGTQWDDGNVGLFSIAMGAYTTASGYGSTAMGQETRASGDYSTATGYSTTASGASSTAMGNSTAASGTQSTAMGASTFASGHYSTAMGLSTVASGAKSTAMGSNTTASGDYSTAMGAYTIASGNYSTALGNYMDTGSKVGSFVIGDKSTTTTFTAGSVNRFYGRFENGYCLYTNSACSIAAILYGGANSWSTLSDVRKKEGFLPADAETVLEQFRTLRLGTWNYIGQSADQFRHYGPMAQEWFAAFGHDGIGTIGNDTTLSSADVDGVLCVAVKALEKRTRTLQEQLVARDAEIAELKSQLAAQRQATDRRYTELELVVRRMQARQNETQSRLTSNVNAEDER